MVSENLLATYSLLAFIKDQERDDKGKGLIGLFVPIVMQTVNWMLRDNRFEPLMGKDYTEIKAGIKHFFELDMPIEVIDAIMGRIYEEDKDALFIINKDHSFIIKQGFAVSIDKDYENQKYRISKLEKHYRTFVKDKRYLLIFKSLLTLSKTKRIESLREMILFWINRIIMFLNMLVSVSGGKILFTRFYAVSIWAVLFHRIISSRLMKGLLIRNCCGIPISILVCVI